VFLETFQVGIQHVSGVVSLRLDVEVIQQEESYFFKRNPRGREMDSIKLLPEPLSGTIP
jgi:hypothetical protein